MRTAPAAALSLSLLACAGCGGKSPDRSPPVAHEVPRGECLASAAHKLCQAAVSAGEATTRSAAHRASAAVGDRARRVSSAQHVIDAPAVSP